MSGDAFTLRPLADKAPLIEVMQRVWGSHKLVVGLGSYDVAEIDGLGLFLGEELVAVASWTLRNQTGYLCALHALKEGEGYASRLLDGVRAEAKHQGAKKLKAMVTNDNMPGLIFYQLKGFRFANLFVGAVDAYRPLIPSLITHGYKGIPVHDALELEVEL